MDKIIMKDMMFFGYHGVLEEENRIGQKFILDVVLHADFKEAALNDNVEDTISYADVYVLVKDIVEKKQFRLIETLAENIAMSTLAEFKKVIEISVKVKKPEAPVPGIFDYFGVEIRRNRDDYSLS